MTTVISSETPTARKTHVCSFCYRTIQVGERYSRQWNVAYDEPYTFKCCLHCQAMVARLEYDQLDWSGDGYTAEAMCDYEPRTVAEARLVVMWRRKWTRRDGELYPVPGKEETA